MTVERPYKRGVTLCYADGCDRLVQSLGLCSKHYQRMFKYGDVSACKLGRPIEERFWSHTLPGENGCIEWQAARTDKGYGLFGVRKGLQVRAHRFAYELVKGPLPESLPGMCCHGVCVLHKCDNPPCVNPEHLFAGTVADNIHDMDSKARGRRPGSPGASNSHAKLSAEEIATIRSLYGVERQKDVGERYGVSQTQISAIQTGKAWKPG